MNTKIIRETGVEKTAKNPVKIKSAEPIKKPDWIRIKLHTSPKFQDVKAKLRKSSLRRSHMSEYW